MNFKQRLTTDQAIGGVADQFNRNREAILNDSLKNIEYLKNLDLSAQDENFIRALDEVQKVRDFIGEPDKILGSELTKHGEIAEQVEVGIGNAKQALHGLPNRFSFDGVGRTAPEDFIMDGIKAQSKFINGENNTLRAILEHLDKYENINFGRDGSKYVIPKDFYENIEALRRGQDIPEFSARKIRAILSQVEKIENETGKPFEEVVTKSISTYKEVQQGNIISTVDNHEQVLETENNEIKNEIKDKAEDDKNIAYEESKPSLQEGLKVAAISAALEGSIQTALLMFSKKKSLMDYDQDDWKEVGIEFLKSSGKGAVRGAAVYGLTNYASMSAPLAASFTSAAFGVSKIYSSYKNGEISKQEMLEQGEVLCFDTTLNLLGSTLGQALIPIPVLGSVIGSISANVLGGIIKDELEAKENELIELSETRYKEYMSRLDNELASEIESLVVRMNTLWGLSNMVFDYNNNASLRFEYSQELALEHGVAKEKVLMSESDIDNYFLD